MAKSKFPFKGNQKIKKFTRKQLKIQERAANVQRVKWGTKSPPKPGAWKR